ALPRPADLIRVIRMLQPCEAGIFSRLVRRRAREKLARGARDAVIVLSVIFTALPAWAQAPGNAQPPAVAAPRAPAVPAIPADGRLTYRGFTVDATEIRGVPQYTAIMISLVHQIDIVADCGVRPEIMQFFRTQTVFVKRAKPHFHSNSPGVTLGDA